MSKSPMIRRKGWGLGFWLESDEFDALWHVKLALRYVKKSYDTSKRLRVGILARKSVRVPFLSPKVMIICLKPSEGWDFPLKVEKKWKKVKKSEKSDEFDLHLPETLCGGGGNLPDSDFSSKKHTLFWHFSPGVRGDPWSERKIEEKVKNRPKNGQFD